MNLTRPHVRALALLAAAGLLATGLAACGKPKAAPPTKKPAATAPAESSAEPPEPEAQAVWPLTGVAGEVEARPALSVKIENPPEARPQSGLEQADVVWEEIVEGGISRFVAVFNSQLPQAVGPVRSVRPMDGAILGATGGLLACSGGQERFLELAEEAGLQLISDDYGDPGFYRNPDRRGDHSVYATPTELLAQADDAHQAAPKGDFEFALTDTAATAAASGTPATELALTMSGLAKPRWTWDGATWLRSEKDEPAMSASGGQLGAANVVALMVQVEAAGGTDAAGSEIPYVQMVGEGRALVASGGKTLEATWTKAGVNDPVVLKDAQGQEIRLAPGNTWVELVPAAEGSWTLV